MQQCTRRRLVVDTLGFMRLQKTKFWLSKGRDIVFILPKNSLLFAFIINQYSLRSLDFRDFQFMLIYAVCHKQILLKLSKHSLSTFCHRPSFLKTCCAEHYPGEMDNGIGVFFWQKGCLRNPKFNCYLQF